MNNKSKIEHAVEKAARSFEAEAEVICMNDIETKPITWLWPDRIACGKITVIAGNPGLGKSLIIASFSAIVSSGLSWPACQALSMPGDVILLSAEDDPADTIKPRLIAAGANVKRCHILSSIKTPEHLGKTNKRSFDLTKDVGRLREVIRNNGNVKLVVIDPISAYLGTTDSHNNADIRSTLSPLSEMASSCNVAIILVTHLNKSSNHEPIGRIIGSIGMIAAARAGYIVSKDENDPNIRYFLPVKNNLGDDNDAFAYHIENSDINSEIIVPKVMWHHDPLDACKILNPEKKTQTNGAKAFLVDLLGEGSKPAKEIFEAAESIGYSKASIQRATTSLGIKRKKDGMEGGWVWSLP